MSAAPSAMIFADSEAYERFMGAWSRAVTPLFLEWLAAEDGLHWLDVGCGTGILTDAVLRSAQPKGIEAIDPSAAQVASAARQLPGARFAIAQAEALPFRDETFDVVASALVINFLRDAAAGVREMRRVVRDGGVVAGFVWDFAANRSPSWPMREAMRDIGAPLPDVPGTAASAMPALEAVFEGAGFGGIRTDHFDVSIAYSTFDEYWIAQTPSYSPSTPMINALSEEERARLKDRIRSILAVREGERFGYAAHAHAVAAIAPPSR